MSGETSTRSTGNLIKTPYYDFHVEAGAKMVPFAGFLMPVQYAGGITAEHLAVRDNVGTFDLSHMGEFEVSGPQALEFLQHATVNNVAKMEVGACLYNCMCQPDGGIVDDLLVYKLPTRYMLVVKTWGAPPFMVGLLKCVIDRIVLGY